LATPIDRRHLPDGAWKFEDLDMEAPPPVSSTVPKNLFRAYAAKSPVRQRSLRRGRAAQKEMILIVNGDESRCLTFDMSRAAGWPRQATCSTAGGGQPVGVRSMEVFGGWIIRGASLSGNVPDHEVAQFQSRRLTLAGDDEAGFGETAMRPRVVDRVVSPS
jgi:hypothetical protein